MALLIAFVTFIVASLICMLVWFSFSAENTQEVIQRRMDAVRRAERRGPVGLGVELVRDEMMSSVPALNRIMMSWSWSTRLQDFVMQAGLKIRPGKFRLLSGVFGFGAFLGAARFTPVPVPILVGGAAAI